MKYAAISAVLCVVVFVGCKNEKDSAVAAPAAAAPAAPESACGPGATVDTAGGYCIKLPAGWKVVETDEGSKLRKHYGVAEADVRVVISIYPADGDFEQLLGFQKKDAEVKDAQKLIGSGELPNGGFYFGKNFGTGIGLVGSIVKGKNGPVECSLNAADAKIQDAYEACKSLRSL
jgi:hypothetical protein